MSHKNCKCASHPTSATQNLEEMEFERSICAAALDRDIGKVREFIKKGRVNDRDHYGYNSLAYAARNGDLEMCRLLIENGIDVNAETKSGSRAIHRAAMMGHHAIVKLLLDHKACPSAVDDAGQTPLHRGANYLQVVRILLGADESLKFIKDKKGKLPFDLLSDSSSDELKLLLDCNNFHHE